MNLVLVNAGDLPHDITIAAVGFRVAALPRNDAVGFADLWTPESMSSTAPSQDIAMPGRTGSSSRREILDQPNALGEDLGGIHLDVG